MRELLRKGLANWHILFCFVVFGKWLGLIMNVNASSLGCFRLSSTQRLLMAGALLSQLAMAGSQKLRADEVAAPKSPSFRQHPMKGNAPSKGSAFQQI